MGKLSRRTLSVVAVIVVLLAGWAAPAAAAHVTILQNYYSKQCLTQEMKNTFPTTRVYMARCGDSQGLQNWELRALTSTPANDYYIINNNSGMCLDQHYNPWPTTPQQQLYAWNCNFVNTNQVWKIGFRGPGNILFNEASEWCLNQTFNVWGPLPTVNANNCTSDWNQQWLNW